MFSNWTLVLAFCLVKGGYSVKGEFVNEEEPHRFNLAKWTSVETTSTCGTKPEVYCILTGAGKKKDQDCRTCDKEKFELSHPIAFATDGTERWWKSENHVHEVNITISLGQEFFIAYIILKMGRSPRPGNWVLEKSTDFGKTYMPWQYFGMTISDCVYQYGLYPKKYASYEDEVLCSADYSTVTPLEYGEIHLNLLKYRPGIETFNTNKQLQEWSRATNIRLRFQKIRTLNGELMMVIRNDKTVTRRYFYSLRDISIGGTCVCYGHANSCSRNLESGKLECKCLHNTCGPSCTQCCSGFHQLEWKPATRNSNNSCQACNCFNHAFECYYNETVAAKNQSLNLDGDFIGGGVCINCQHKTTGLNCEKCIPGYYRPERKSHYDWDACTECQCNVNGSISNFCESTGGKCECKKGVTGHFCDKCETGLWNFPVCEECKCNNIGSYSIQCDSTDGLCRCKPGVQGRQCKICDSASKKYSGVSYLTSVGCLPCRTCSMTLRSSSIGLKNQTEMVHKDLKASAIEDLYQISISNIRDSLWEYQDKMKSMVYGSELTINENRIYNLNREIEVEEINLSFVKNTQKKIAHELMSIGVHPPLEILANARHTEFFIQDMFLNVKGDVEVLNAIAINDTVENIKNVESMAKYAVINMEDILDWDEIWSKVLMERNYANDYFAAIQRKFSFFDRVKKEMESFELKLNTIIPSFQWHFNDILNKTLNIFGLNQNLQLKKSIINSMHFSIEELYLASQPIFQKLEKSARMSVENSYTAVKSEALLDQADESLYVYSKSAKRSRNGFDSHAMAEKTLNHSAELQSLKKVIELNLGGNTGRYIEVISSLDVFKEIKHSLELAENSSQECIGFINEVNKINKIDLSKNYTKISLFFEDLASKYALHVKDLKILYEDIGKIGKETGTSISTEQDSNFTMLTSPWLYNNHSDTIPAESSIQPNSMNSGITKQSKPTTMAPHSIEAMESNATFLDEKEQNFQDTTPGLLSTRHTARFVVNTELFSVGNSTNVDIVATNSTDEYQSTAGMSGTAASISNTESTALEFSRSSTFQTKGSLKTTSSGKEVTEHKTADSLIGHTSASKSLTESTNLTVISSTSPTISFPETFGTSVSSTAKVSWWWRPFADGPASRKGRQDYMIEGKYFPDITRQAKQEKKKFKELADKALKKVDEKWNELMLNCYKTFNSEKVLEKFKFYSEEMKRLMINTTNAFKVIRKNVKDLSVDRSINEYISENVAVNSSERNLRLWNKFNDVEKVTATAWTVHNEAIKRVEDALKVVRNNGDHHESRGKNFEEIHKKIELQKSVLKSKLKFASRLASKFKNSYHFASPGFIEMLPMDNLKNRSLSTEVHLSIKPEYKNGLVLQLGDTTKPNDTALLLEMVERRPRMTLFRTHHDPISLLHFAPLTMYEWNTIAWRKIGRTISLVIVQNNGKELAAKVLLPMESDLLTSINGPVFIGGLPDEIFRTQTPDLDGCLSEVIINGQEVGFLGARYTRGIQHICDGSEVGEINHSGQASFGGKGYIAMPKESTFKLNPLMLEFKFRTYDSNATILLLSEITEAIQLVVCIENGRVSAKYFDQPSVAATEKWNYNDGKWHQVKILRKNHRTNLVVDNRDRKTVHSLKWQYGEQIDMFYIGGMPEITSEDIGVFIKRFEGCIADFYVNGKPIDMSRFSQAYDVTFNGCRIKWQTKCACLKSGSASHLNFRPESSLITHLAFSSRTSSQFGMIMSYSSSMYDSLMLTYNGTDIYLDHINISGKKYRKKYTVPFINGAWHNFVFQFRQNGTNFIVDQTEDNFDTVLNDKMWPSQQLIHFGYHPNVKFDLIGEMCFKDVIVNERLHDLKATLGGKEYFSCREQYIDLKSGSTADKIIDFQT